MRVYYHGVASPVNESERSGAAAPVDVVIGTVLARPEAEEAQFVTSTSGSSADGSPGRTRTYDPSVNSLGEGDRSDDKE